MSASGYRSPEPGPRLVSGTAPVWMLGLVAVEFLLGMAVNLFVRLPSAHAGMSAMMSVGPTMVLHMVLGMVLGVGAIVTVVRALGRGRRVVWCAGVGLAGILISGIAGMVFLMGGQDNGASFLMAAGFLVAVGGYAAELIIPAIARPAGASPSRG